MKKSLVFISTLLLFAIMPTTVEASECKLNIEKAYQTAVREGWRFKCLGGVIDWNKQKKIGCRVRSMAIPGPTPTPLATMAAFFINTTNQDATRTGKLKGGWRIKSFNVSGGEYSKGVPSNTTRMHFTFAQGKGKNKIYRRHLNELIVEHSIVNKSCKNVYNEAFK